MTDNTNFADKVQEIIEKMNADLKVPSSDEKWGDGYDTATVFYKERLEALLPKPRTLADELRKPIPTEANTGNTAWFEVSELRALADRVETLETERDISAEALKVQAEVTSEALDRVEEQAAEIARLRAREIPDGWRVAEHPYYGTVLTTNVEDGHGNLEIHRIAPNGRSVTVGINPFTLWFRDEAPAPEETPEPGHIDPATCGQYDWYLVEVGVDKCHGIRIDPTDRVSACGFISPDSRFTFAGDGDLTVIRKLTESEMDER